MGWNSEDYLMHHGIKGQKWGIRRFQNKDGTRTALGKRREKTDGNRKFALSDKQKSALKIAGGVAIAGAAAYGVSKLGGSKASQSLSSVKKMSDDDLLEKIGRLEREKKYIDLSREVSSYGQSKSKRILQRSGEVAAGTIATAGIIYGGKQTIKAVANMMNKDGDRLVRDIFPKKK